MPTTFAARLSGLAFLLPLTIVFAPGCDDRAVSDKELEEIEEEEEEEIEEEEVLPESHEGEGCEGKAGVIQACSDGESLGSEICLEDLDSYELRWSACFVDSCEEIDTTRECTAQAEGDEGEGEGEDTKGTQYCFEAPSEARFWGACVTDPACTVGESKSCGLGLGIEMSCYLNDVGEPQWDWGACNTPLVLSFDGREPAYAAAPAAAKAFDINGARACLNPDWPSAATPWLARDRDHNGSIDGGHELFGNGTRMATGDRAEQGFEALRELDGDGDGRITPADPAWSELVLWADYDADRRSSGWELLSLESYGVEAIELDYRNEVVCDGRGNCGAERAAFTFRDGGQARTGEVVDVYLACGE